MKPVSAIQNTRSAANRRFPLVDCNYRPLGFDGFSIRCAGKPRPSFGQISQSYFNGEARRNFVAEAIAFVLITALTVPAIIDCGRALLDFMRAIGM
jgi:hypothetical protein